MLHTCDRRYVRKSEPQGSVHVFATPRLRQLSRRPCVPGAAAREEWDLGEYIRIGELVTIEVPQPEDGLVVPGQRQQARP